MDNSAINRIITKCEGSLESQYLYIRTRQHPLERAYIARPAPPLRTGSTTQCAGCEVLYVVDIENMNVIARGAACLSAHTAQRQLPAETGIGVRLRS
jgi:hypothetical protein